MISDLEDQETARRVDNCNHGVNRQNGDKRDPKNCIGILLLEVNHKVLIKIRRLELYPETTDRTQGHKIMKMVE